MEPIRIRKHVDSETLHLPELREVIGRDVEITVRATDEEPLETLETFLGGAPLGELPTGAELEELRAAAALDPALAAALRLAERGGLDIDAIVELRANSHG